MSVDQPATLWRVQRRLTKEFTGPLHADQMRWHTPFWGHNQIKTELRTARAALTRYRDKARPGEHFALFELTGTWTEDTNQ